jgi:hypothetical protein
VKLIRLTYFSRNQLDLFNAPMCDRVAEIVASSVGNNNRDALSSVLIYDAKWFAQVIEGDERTIVQRFERILRDQRHCDVSLVAMTPITMRDFPSIPMIGIAHDAGNTDLFRHYCGSHRFDPQRLSAEGLIQLIEAVISRRLDDGPLANARSTFSAA